MPQDILLSTRDLKIGYKHTRGEKVIAAELELDVPRGELICLVGPNGAGKSTLLRTLAGLHDALKGLVLLDDREIGSLSPLEIARILALVLTEKVEIEGFNVFDMVALGRFPHTDWKGSLREEDRNIIIESLRMVQGESLAERNINELSDGERQKVMVARALAQEPELILLDEPTSFLDLLRKVEIVKIMKDLARKRNKAVVIALHDISLALQYADRIWLMELSGIMHQGAPEDLVLSGKITETFSSGSLVFDPLTGSYPFKIKQDRPIVFQGEGMAAFWTGKALEKEGFYLVSSVDDPGGTPLLSIQVSDDRPEWVLEAEGRKERFSSIYGFLRGIRAYY